MEQIMEKQDHLDYLGYLESKCGQGEFGPALLKVEGSFYFGSGYSHDEYTELYKARCKHEGWLEEKE